MGVHSESRLQLCVKHAWLCPRRTTRPVGHSPSTPGSREKPVGQQPGPCPHGHCPHSQRAHWQNQCRDRQTDVLPGGRCGSGGREGGLPELMSRVTWGGRSHLRAGSPPRAAVAWGSFTNRPSLTSASQGGVRVPWKGRVGGCSSLPLRVSWCANIPIRLFHGEVVSPWKTSRWRNSPSGKCSSLQGPDGESGQGSDPRSPCQLCDPGFRPPLLSWAL